MLPHPRKRLQVAARCDVPFDAMAPRGSGRHCAECDRVVTNLSAMTEREAIALFRAKGGDLCGYVVHDGRGEPLFAPEPRGRLALGAALAVALELAACEPTTEATPAVAALAPTGLAPTDPARGEQGQLDAATADATGELPPCAVMMPMSEAELMSADESELAISVDEASSPGGEADEASLASAEENAFERTPEDRARERRKRLTRQPRARPQPHTAYGGMMMMME